MIPHQLPDCPWEEVSADYFTLHTQDYLLVVDYYSKYPEVHSNQNSRRHNKSNESHHCRQPASQQKEVSSVQQKSGILK